MALMVAREVPTSSTMAVPHGPASVGAARRRLRRDLGDREVPDTVIDDAVLILSELLSNSCRYARPLAPLFDLDGGAARELLEPQGDLANPPQSTAEADGAAGVDEAAEEAEEAEEAAALHALLVGVRSGRERRADRAGRGGRAERGERTERAEKPAETGGVEDPGGVLVRWQMHTDGLLTLEVTDGGAATRPLPASPSLTSKGGRGLSIVGTLAVDWGVRDAPGEVTVWAALPAHVEHDTEHARSA